MINPEELRQPKIRNLANKPDIIEGEQFYPEQILTHIRQRLDDGVKLNQVFENSCHIGGQSPEGMQSLLSRSRRLWERARARIMCAGAVGMAVLAFSGAGEFGPRAAEAAEKFSARQNNAIEKLNENTYEATINKLRQAALTETNERYVVFAGKNGNYKPVFEGIGKNSSLELNVYEVNRHIDSRETSEIEIVHTHPLAFKKSLPENQSEKDDKLANVMPPSFQDMQFAILTDNYFARSGKKVKNSVIEPTGKWEFSVDRDNDFIRAVADLYNNDFQKIYGSITEEEKGIIKKEKGDLFAITDPRAYLSCLLSDPKTKVIGARLQNDLSKLVYEKMARFQDRDLDNIVMLPDLITRGDGNKKEMIFKFIESARKNGINIKYIPFENKK